MVSNSDVWKRVPLDRFRADFNNLTPYGQWIVTKTLDAMIRHKDPTRVYQNTICDNCVPDLRLFGIQDDGVGNKGLGLLIYLDRERRVLYPISVNKTTPPNT